MSKSETGNVPETPRGAPGCTCGTPPFAPPEPSNDCPIHSARGTCRCGSCEAPPADFMPVRRIYPDEDWATANQEAAREIAWGISCGAWCCDCVEWTWQDAAMAYEYLHAQEMQRREVLRSGLTLIAQHADLDLNERGVAEAERYAVIARDAISKAGLA